MKKKHDIPQYGSFTEFVNAIHDTRRIVRVKASNDLIIATMREGWDTGGVIKCTKGVPETAIFIGSLISPTDPLCVEFLFYDPSFEPVEDGCQIPSLLAEYELVCVEDYHD